MYREHFGLSTDPFTLSPNLKFIFMSKAHEETMAHLAYGLEQGEDFILITGEIGTGKTLALHNLISQLSQSLRVVFIGVTQLNFRALVKLALKETGSTVDATADIADLLAAFKRYLVAERAEGRRVLLIIDEAQNLNVEVLEGLRMLANLAQPGEQALQIVFSGQLKLGQTIDCPELIQLRQRIRVRYRLETLDRAELEAYVNHRLKIAGHSEPLLNPKALDLVYEASGGVPRLVNHLVSKALLAAFVDGATMVERKHVDTSDLPVPQAEPKTLPSEIAPPVPVTSDASDASGATDVVDRVLAPLEPSDPMPADPVSADRHRITDEPRPPQPVQPTQPPQPKQPAEPRRRRRLAWNLAVTILLLAAAGYVAWDLSAGFTRLPWAGRTLPWTDRQQSATEPGTGATADLAEHVPVNPAIAATDSGATATVENEIATGDHDQDGTANESSDRATEVTGNAEIAGETGYESALPVDRGGAEPADAADPPIETNLANASDPTNGADGELISQAGYCVHVASFARPTRADRCCDEFLARRLPSFVRETVIHDEVWYRVYVGPYTTPAEAESAQRRIQTNSSIKYSMIVDLRHG